MVATNFFAVARIILSAIGRLCARLSFEAAIASVAVTSTTVPFHIATAAYNSSFSLDSLRTTLKTSYIVIIGTTSEDASFKGFRKYLAFDSSAKYAGHPADRQRVAPTICEM